MTEVAQRTNILTTHLAGSITPARSAVPTATRKVIMARKSEATAPIRVDARPVATIYQDGTLTNAGKRDCRHGNCKGLTDFVDDNHSVPHSNIADL